MRRVISTPGELLEEIHGILQAYHSDCVESLLRNRHMNDLKEGEKLDKRHLDAVLVDFMNRIGAQYGVDYAMYASDLKKPDPQPAER
jgi:hypothetical protein